MLMVEALLLHAPVAELRGTDGAATETWEDKKRINKLVLMLDMAKK